CAQFIFLELVQLGEEGKDTRRRVLKSELLGKKYGKEVMESVLKKLSDARLIVVGGLSPLTPLSKGGTHQEEKVSLGKGKSLEEYGDVAKYGDVSPLVLLSKGGTNEEETNKKAPLGKGGLGGLKITISQESLPDATTPHSTLEDNNKKAPLPKEGLGGSEITVEVAHEILICHWSTLRWWLDENRSRLQQQRQMEQDAKKWVQHGRVDDFLLRGVALQNAEELYIKYGDELSELTQEFIEAGMALRQRQEEEKRLGKRRTILGLVSGLAIVSLLAVGAVWQWRRAVVGEMNAVLKGEIATLEYLGATSLGRQLDVIALGKKLKAGWVSLENRVRGIVLLQQTFDFEKWKEFKTLLDPSLIYHVSFSPDGKLLASAGYYGIVRVWQVDGTPVAVLEGHKDSVRHVSFSPDGKLLASASEDRTVRVWQVDGTPVATLDGHKGMVNHLSFSPDGKLLASASDDGTVRLWLPDGTPVATLDGHEYSIIHVSFSSDGKLLASASDDGTVRLWQADGTVVATLEGHKILVYHVSFSPDGKLLASASGDSTVRLWLPDGTAVATLEGHKILVYHVSFSPDGKLLASASGDSTVRLWLPDGTAVATLEGHKDWVNHLFSPDGKLLASASGDGTVRLWLPDGTAVATLEGHKDWVNHLSFSPDGKLLASASHDGTVRLWNLNLDSLLKEGCDWVGDYLRNNPNVSEEDKRLCEGIE
ncbi:MAG: hypothetical protein F6K08_31155, partial [Okeania sp. SIO1H6]|nr:hypothetical protein [Okeania sp. SIO1H6]